MADYIEDFYRKNGIITNNCAFNKEQLESLGENFPHLKEICSIEYKSYGENGITFNQDDNQFYYVQGCRNDNLPEEIEKLSFEIANEMEADGIEEGEVYCFDNEEINAAICKRLPELLKPKFGSHNATADAYFDPVGWIGYYWPLKDIINELEDIDYMCATWVNLCV